MKLLFYIATLHGGGAERVISNLANGFAKRNTDVFLVTDSMHEDEYEINNYIHRYALNIVNGKSRIKKNIAQVLSLRKLIKMIKPDVMVSFLPENNIRAHFAKLNLKVRHMVSLRNIPQKVFESSRSGVLVKYVFKKADTIIVQTEDAKDWIEKELHKNAYVIMNQVDEKFFNIHRKEENDIVAVGKFLPQKNHMLLIRAYAKIADQIEENLIIYGDGVMREDYEALIHELKIEKRVFLPGFSETMQDVYASCRLFVLSSDFEGMPNVLLEAMAAGTPCISTDCPCGGPRMVIKDGFNGKLVECGNEIALADALLFYLKNDVVRKEMGKKAAENAKIFEPENIFHKWENVIITDK